MHANVFSQLVSECLAFSAQNIVHVQNCMTNKSTLKAGGFQVVGWSIGCWLESGIFGIYRLHVILPQWVVAI